MTETLQTRSAAIHCEGCAKSIERSLGKMTGVRQVKVDIADKTVHVEYDTAQVTDAAVRERLALAGFRADPS